MKRILLGALLAVVAVTAALTARASGGRARESVELQSEPAVRIGLNQNLQSLNIRSAQNFTVQGNSTRSARFATILSLDPAAAGRTLSRTDLQYRMMIELDSGRLLVLPMTTKVRIAPTGTPLRVDQIENRTYRGTIEVFGNSRNTFTVVNELPLEEYLLGVVPNELSPTTFGQIEALKAQAVAARTYIVRNMGQYKNEGYDICATDACQVYFGAGTEQPVSTDAVNQTRGMIAAYNGLPINALYSSTCGGRTENVENIFDEKLPYLVSTFCEYKHPDTHRFSSTRAIPDWKEGVLSVAGVANFTDLRRFLGMTGQGEPSSAQGDALASFIRTTFYPNVKTDSDTRFLTEQGILGGQPSTKEILFRLIDKKTAFEWQQGVLVSWDGQVMTLLVNGQPKEFKLSPEAPVYERIGEERVPKKEGTWIGGELIDFRAVDGTIQFLVYRLNFANQAADRYSRLAIWQTHKTKQEIETALAPLNLGEIRDFRIIQRGPSERPIATEVIGSRGRQTVRALRIRSLLALRDSLFYFDAERNARGELIGMTFYGRGWGHGVGMCQVGAYGMALAGATYEEILKKYYTGIEIRKLY